MNGVPSCTSTGNLSEVFSQNDLELSTRLAQLSVLYEDLRHENQQLATLSLQHKHESHAGSFFEMLYYIRRSLVTLTEFQGALGAVTQTQGFKAKVDSLHPPSRKAILDGNKYLQMHARSLKEMRNNFGGHYLYAVAKQAINNLNADKTGKIFFHETANRRWALHLDYTSEILLAGLGRAIGKRPETFGELKRDFADILSIIHEAYGHAQVIIYALVNQFLKPGFTDDWAEEDSVVTEGDSSPSRRTIRSEEC